MVLSPAGIELCAIHLFSRGSRVSRGHDCIVFINDYCPEVTPKAGALVRTPRCQIQKIVMPVGSHSKSVWQSPVLKKHDLKCNGLLSPCTRDNPIHYIVHGSMVLFMEDITIIEVAAQQCWA
jgi:hypothetical protein